MYSILIVDDEKILREGIGESFTARGDFEVHFASNGAEALEKLNETPVDVVIIDIVMPVMNGIELLKKLKERGNEAVKVVLSAYEEFKFAREAFANDALDYLIKPCFPDDVSALAGRLAKAVEERRTLIKERRQMLDYVEKSRGLIRESLIEDLISGRLERSDYERRRDFLGDFSDAGVYCVMAVKFGLADWIANAGAEQYQAELLNLAQMAQGVMKGYENGIYLKNTSDIFTFLFKTDGKDARGVFERLQKCGAQKGAAVYGGISGVVNDIFDIRHSYREAITALKYNIAFYKNDLICIDDIQCGGEGAGRAFDEEAFATFLKLGDREGALACLDACFEQGAKYAHKACLYSLELLLTRAHLSAITVLLEHDAGAFEAYLGGGYPAAPINETATLEQRFNAVRSDVENIAGIITSSRENNNNRAVESVKRYILANYNREINLNDIAAEVFLSKNYLGQLFKQKTGLNVLDYVHRVRIAKAKELIETSNMKIYEIAETVGYSDQHYFSAMFKRMVGVTPTEYRLFSQ